MNYYVVVELSSNVSLSWNLYHSLSSWRCTCRHVQKKMGKQATNSSCGNHLAWVGNWPLFPTRYVVIMPQWLEQWHTSNKVPFSSGGWKLGTLSIGWGIRIPSSSWEGSYNLRWERLTTWWIPNCGGISSLKSLSTIYCKI